VWRLNIITEAINRRHSRESMPLRRVLNANQPGQTVRGMQPQTRRVVTQLATFAKAVIAKTGAGHERIICAQPPSRRSLSGDKGRRSINLRRRLPGDLLQTLMRWVLMKCSRQDVFYGAYSGRFGSKPISELFPGVSNRTALCESSLVAEPMIMIRAAREKDDSSPDCKNCHEDWISGTRQNGNTDGASVACCRTRAVGVEPERRAH
jgi:hypothetical protein